VSWRQDFTIVEKGKKKINKNIREKVFKMKQIFAGKN
jgi:hypothetical protein